MLFFRQNLQADECVAELQQYVSVNALFPYQHLIPSILEIEQQVIVPLIGQTTYNLTQIEYNKLPDDNVSTAYLNLISHIQAVVAKLSMAVFTPFNEVQFDANGITTVGKSENRTAAYDYQIQRIIATLARSGNNAIEALLKYLAANIGTFTAYATSPEYTANKTGLVNSAKSFSEIYYIAESGLTFRALRPIYLGIEEDRLKPLIGDSLYTELTGNLTDALKKKLLRACKKACVFQTLADALELQLPFEINSDGLRVHYSSEYGNVRYFMPPTDAQIQATRAACQRRADEGWTAIADILLEINPPAEAIAYSPIVGEDKFIAL